VFSRIRNNTKVICPHANCKKEIAQEEVYAYLNNEEREEINKITFENYIKNDPNMAVCPCGAVIEV